MLLIKIFNFTSPWIIPTSFVCLQLMNHILSTLSHSVCTFCTMWVCVCVSTCINMQYYVSLLGWMLVSVLKCSCVYGSSICPACMHPFMFLYLFVCVCVCNFWVWSSCQFAFSLDPGCGRWWPKIARKNAEVAGLWPPTLLSCLTSSMLETFSFLLDFFFSVLFYCCFFSCTNHVLLYFLLHLLVVILVSSMVSFASDLLSPFCYIFHPIQLLCPVLWVL